MPAQLLTNPGSNLSPALIARYHIALLPQRITVDGVTHDTRDEIPQSEVDRWVKTAKQWPSAIGTTAAETVKALLAAARSGHTDHLLLTTSRHLINSFQSGEVGARTFLESPQGRGHHVAVVDTTVTDVGAGLVCVLAAEALKAGGSLQDVEGLLNHAVVNARMAAGMGTLENAVKGGRAGFLRAFVADMLGVRPILGFVDGALQMVGKYNKRTDMVDEMAGYFRANVTPGRTVWLGLAHSGDVDAARRLRTRLEETYRVTTAYLRPTAPGVYLHAGPGSLCASLLPVDGLRLGARPFEAPALGDLS